MLIAKYQVPIEPAASSYKPEAAVQQLRRHPTQPRRPPQLFELRLACQGSLPVDFREAADCFVHIGGVRASEDLDGPHQPASCGYELALHDCEPAELKGVGR